jgi:hypothetical protein
MVRFSFCKNHTVKALKGEIYLCAFSILTLNGGEKTASHFGHFSLRKKKECSLENRMGPLIRFGRSEEEFHEGTNPLLSRL